MIVKTKDLAGLFECHKATITAWRRLGLEDACLGRDKWDLRKAVLWWATNILETGNPGSDDQSLQSARRDYWRARADREQLRVQKERGELLPKEDVLTYWANRIREVWSGLYVLQHRLPPLLTGKSRAETQDIIKGEVFALNTNYVREGRFCPPCYRVDQDGALIELPGVKHKSANSV